MDHDDMRPSLQPSPDGVPGGVLAFMPIAAAEHAEAHASALLPDESELASSLPPARRAPFVAGRIALRAAVQAVAPDSWRAPLLRTDRGGPLLPIGVSGSVSHKRTHAIAVAAQMEHGHVGVDLEIRPSQMGDERIGRRSLANRILTPRELDAIAALDEVAHREATLLRFALKEAVYKAIDPFVHRYVGFTEVEVDVTGTERGRAAVTLMLPECRTRELSVQAHWWFDGPWIVTTATSRG